MTPPEPTPRMPRSMMLRSVADLELMMAPTKTRLGSRCGAGIAGRKFSDAEVGCRWMQVGVQIGAFVVYERVANWSRAFSSWQGNGETMDVWVERKKKEQIRLVSKAIQ